MGALASLGGAVAYATAAGGRLTYLALGTGAAALVILTVGVVFRLAPAIPWAVMLVGAGYLATRAGSDVVDGWAAAVGAALLLAAELAAWSIDHDARFRSERGLVLRRVGMLGGLIVVALVADFLLLATAAVSTTAGLLLAAVGVAAAVAAVAIVLRLLRAS